MNLPPDLMEFANVIIDSYFVVDLERNIVEYNRAFHSMLPRAVARNLKGKKCYEVLQLGICKDNCIAEQCWRRSGHVRLDEILGQLATESQEFRFILSAIPIREPSGTIVGALEMQRNVTDEASVQVKYQRQIEASAKQQRELEDSLHTRTERLVQVSRRLYEAQRALLRARTELFG